MQEGAERFRDHLLFFGEPRFGVFEFKDALDKGGQGVVIDPRKR